VSSEETVITGAVSDKMQTLRDAQEMFVLIVDEHDAVFFSAEEILVNLENNESLVGDTWWEKILRVIPADKIKKSAFSEFETYGTYTALRHAAEYRLREWHSFRLGAEFFDQNTICDRDYTWLSRDFQAISFEKNQSVREDHRNLFDNPDYQSKLSATQMLEIAQEEFEEGYREVWDPDGNKFENIY